MTSAKKQKTTVNPKEVEQFQQIADLWWDETGPFKPLHKFNPTRLAYIRDIACSHFGTNPKGLTPFDGLSVLDIGCGGGLLSEPMAKMGANVTGIDAGEKNINIAKLHAKQSNLKIDYHSQTVEELAKTLHPSSSLHSPPLSRHSVATNDSPKDQRLTTNGSPKFDIILNMEVIEHVDNVPLFLESSAKLLKKDGLMFVATLNRTVKSYGLAIIGAEYILRWLPRGTHDWHKFLKPSEIATHLQPSPVTLHDITGCSYNPLTDTWKRSKNTDVNYIMAWKKP